MPPSSGMSMLSILLCIKVMQLVDRQERRHRWPDRDLVNHSR
ncbi:hypothetical protein OAS67_00575 [Alphaproteobacteria bacterium]|nr:hypothetical protein [Alphaproteobacteria bacterium]